MSRSFFRNIWIIFMICMLGTSFFIFKKGQKEQVNVERALARLTQVQRELRNVRNLSSSLAELDSLTIDEKSATQLGLLRHLELEKGGFDFNSRGKRAQKTRAGEVFLRDFTISAKLPYADALSYMDSMHANKKVVLNAYELKSANRYGDEVTFEIKGTLYGLEKN